MNFVNQITALFHRISSRLIFRLLFLVSIPLFFLSLSNYFLYRYYFTVSENEAITKYQDSLSILSDEIYQLFIELYFTNDLLCSNQDFIDFLTATDPEWLKQTQKIVNNYNSLLSLRCTKDIIENISIYNRDMNYVISTNGTNTGTDFFSCDYVYDVYPEEYWMAFQSAGTGFQLLPPAKATISPVFSNEKSSVIPFVQTTVGKIRSKSLFIININAKKLHNIIMKNQITEHSNIFITDQAGNIFSSTLNKAYSEPDHAYSLSKYASMDSGIYTDRIEGMKYLVLIQESNIMSNSMNYIAYIPFQDVHTALSYIHTASMICFITALFLSVFLSLHFARKIYSPVEHLLTIMADEKEERNESHNDLTFISDSYLCTLDRFNTLSATYDKMAPLALEQHILKILNSEKFFIDDHFSELLKQPPIGFCYPKFCVASVQPNFSKEFFRTFTKEDQLRIYNGISVLARTFIPDRIRVFSLSASINQLYLILNVPETEDLSLIEDALTRFYDIFTFDTDYHQMCIGLGLMQDSFEKLCLSYKQANQAVTMQSPFSARRIRIYQESADTDRYIYGSQDEKLLFNYLISGMEENARSLAESIIQKNTDAGLTEAALKELSCQIYLTGLKVLKKKQHTPQELMGSDFINFLSEYQLLSCNQGIQYLFLFLDRISQMSKKNAEKTLYIGEIESYIRENYNKDIYLEQMAEQYHITSAHLSRIIKKELGVNFTDYLARIRIDKAKELLVTTTSNVNDIAETVGFNSRNTFIRMFKKLEGVTPSVYRASMR